MNDDGAIGACERGSGHACIARIGGGGGSLVGWGGRELNQCETFVHNASMRWVICTASTDWMPSAKEM